MLTNQAKLHKLLALERPSQQQRQQILKIIRIGHYDLPECVFEQAYTILKSGSGGQHRYYHARDLIHSGLELSIGSKLKGYLQKFRDALGDVPAVRKLAAFVDFTVSSQPCKDHFDDLIIDDRTNYDSRKQAISAWKVAYQWEDYVRALNEYLKENPNDPQAWLQLGDFYTQRSQYLRALFCYQEVIMLMPDNDNYFVRLGELYYTDGGKVNLATASRYFSYVISRNPQHPRALWGLYRSLWAQREWLEELELELMENTKEAIQKVYSQRNPALKINLAL